MKYPSLGEKTNGFDTAADVDYGVASSSSWLIFCPPLKFYIHNLHVEFHNMNEIEKKKENRMPINLIKFHKVIKCGEDILFLRIRF